MLASSRSTFQMHPTIAAGGLGAVFEVLRDAPTMCVDSFRRVATTCGAPAAAGALLGPGACLAASASMAAYLPTYVWGLASVGLLYAAVVPTRDTGRFATKTLGLPWASVLGMRAGLSVEKGIKYLFLPR